MSSVLARRSRGLGSEDGTPRASTPNSVAFGDRKRARPDPGNVLQRLTTRQYGAGELEGHQPGAIVRIKMRDFVTFSLIDVYPGPSLNMIIGPNGSGKSTIICAICLGLGWPPQVLGRSKEPSDFVKNNCREAFIEIELKKKPDQRRNTIISRTISKERTKSTYTVNGNAVSATQAKAAAEAFNIQIDNLCQFLPQDRVAEFAAMSETEKLYSTQRAAAGPEMLENHERLKKLRGDQKTWLVASKTDRDALRNHESRHEMQREDVERYKQREGLKQKLSFLEKCRPLPKYAEAKAAYKEAKKTRISLNRELRTLDEELEPSLERVKAKQRYEKEVQKTVKKGRDFLDKAERATNNTLKKVEDLDEKMAESHRMEEAERIGVKPKKADRGRCKNVIVRLKKQMEEPPEPFDMAACNQEMNRLKGRKKEIEHEIGSIQASANVLKERETAGRSQVDTFKKRLAALETQTGQQEHKLSQLSRDTSVAWKWIQENQNEFEKKVYGPPIVECSVKDPKYATVLEAFLSDNDFKAFTVQSQNDFRKLQRILNKEKRLHDISIRVVSDGSMDQYAPILGPDELRRYGMQGFAIDWLEGPDVVLAMLCEKGLHSSAVTLGSITENQYQGLENSNVRNWVVKDTHYTVTRRREYGAAGNSTRTRTIREARFWTAQPVESSLKTQIQQDLREAESDLHSIREEVGVCRGEMNQLRPEYEALTPDIQKLQEEKDARQRAQVAFDALPTKLENEESKMANLDALLANVVSNINKILADRDDLLFEKAETTLAYAKHVSSFRQTHDYLLALEIQHLEAVSDAATLSSRTSHIRDLLGSKREALTAATTLSDQAFQTAKSLEDICRVIMAEASEEEATMAQPYITSPSTDLEAEIESVSSQLALTHTASDHILRDFERREREIQSLRAKLAKADKEIEDLRISIHEIRSVWEPQLLALVGRVSDAFGRSFARIGCAGQVEVWKASSDGGDADANPNPNPNHPDTTSASTSSDGLDFARWELHILVKFRASEPLARLDSHRQSGGERAVATMFYLIALQSLTGANDAPAPFRVVDEINQGMDPRNERMVHGRLVDVACGGDDEGDADADEGDADTNTSVRASQYFLVTPKLLSGLKYRRGMTVHNIVSGQKMPAYSATGPQRVDLGLWAKRGKELGLSAREFRVGGKLGELKLGMGSKGEEIQGGSGGSGSETGTEESVDSISP